MQTDDTCRRHGMPERHLEPMLSALRKGGRLDQRSCRARTSVLESTTQGHVLLERDSPRQPTPMLHA